MAEKAKASKPYGTYRIGSLSLTVWKNQRETQDGKTFDTVSYNLQRSYKDGDGEYKNTDSLGVQDLIVAGALFKLAFTDAGNEIFRPSV